MPIYPSALAFIKERPFDVLAPAYYYPQLPKEMTQPDTTPLGRVNPLTWTPTTRKPPPRLRPVLDPHQLQSCAYSAEIIFDMFRKKVYFQLLHESDVVELLDGVDRYLLSLKDDVAIGTENVVTYVRMVMAFRVELYKHYYRYMMQNPDAKAALYPNNDPNKNFTSLFSSMGIRQEIHQMDPLKARAKPPYDVDKTIPKDPEAKKTEDDDYFGGSASALVDKGEFKFDYDEFLKKGT